MKQKGEGDDEEDENEIKEEEESQGTKKVERHLHGKERLTKGMNLTYERAGGFRCTNYGATTKQNDNYYTNKYQYNQVVKPNTSWNNHEGYTYDQQRNYQMNYYNNKFQGQRYGPMSEEHRRRKEEGFQKHAKWQGERYKEKISKYYDKRKAEAYDEYVEFKKELAEVEEEFLKRLP